MKTIFRRWFFLWGQGTLFYYFILDVLYLQVAHIWFQFTVKINQFIHGRAVLDGTVIDPSNIQSYNKNNTGPYLCVNKISFFISFCNVILFHWKCFCVDEIDWSFIFYGGT